MTKMDFRQRLFLKKGYKIRIDCTKGIYSDNLGLSGDRKKLCLKICYLGPVGEDPVTEESLSDDKTLRKIASPWNGEWNDCATWNIYRDDNDGIWTGYSSLFFLKNEKLQCQKLQLRYTVPPKLAGIRAIMRIYIEDELIFTRDLTDPGTFEEEIDLTSVAEDLVDYLEESHRIQKILLKEFIRVCSKYSIRYYVFCGTALGAFRSGELIEWDDDVDVAMSRSEFDKLASVCNEEWGHGEDFRIVTPKTLSKNYFMDYMTRLVYMKEESPTSIFLRMKGYIDEDLLNRETLDLFILENGSDNEFLHKVQTNTIKGLYGLALGHRPVFEEQSLIYTHDAKQIKIASWLASIGKHIPLSMILRLYDWVRSLFSGTGGKYCFESNGYIGCIGWRFEKAWFGEGKEGHVEDIVVTLPADCDGYLKRQYGNYLGLPRGLARKPSHWDND